VSAPRWEWRTFGSAFGRAEADFAALEPTGVQESDELYLLSPDPAADTVKVRANLLDVKTLRDVDADGLQRWEPTLKAAFPVSADDLRKVLAALRVEPAGGLPDAADVDAVRAFLEPAGVRAVAVHKRRVRYTVGGCTAELSDVTADGRRVRTIAVEDEDAAAVVAAVESLGLDGYRNTSYPRGLAAVLAGTPPRYAVIDVGTNSVKFHIGERDANGAWHRVVDRAEVTRLGEGLTEGGTIDPAALERTIVAAAGMVDEARRLDVVAIAAVGTAGLRAARDGDQAVETARQRTGVRIEIIPGEEEARLAYVAAVSSLGPAPGSLVVFDTGGGSTQFTFGHDAAIEEQFSLPVGAARFTERFGLDRAVGADVVDAACAAIAGEFDRLDGREAPDALIGMGGALTNLAAVKHGLAAYDPDIVSGTVLDSGEVERQIERYRSLDADGRRAIVGLQAGRAAVILAGACIVRVVLDKLRQDRLTVSDRGLRHGVLAERFGTTEEGS
jgi:exopolyphosphatase/guanosine-5'-triphosphate,3'-diphosphate pyrophosphatase